MILGTMSAKGAESAETLITLSSGWKVRHGTRNVSQARPSIYHDVFAFEEAFDAVADDKELAPSSLDLVPTTVAFFCCGGWRGSDDEYNDSG